MIKRFLLAAAMMTLPWAQTLEAAEAPSWIYMDLGEVIVTGNPTAGYTYVPGALAFLQSLRTHGYKIALISNIPEAWGATCADKFAMLQQFLGSHLQEPVPMDWSLFDKVVLPPFDRYRKPQPYVFVQGLANACPGKTLYLGENANEIDVAKDLGYATHLIEGAVEDTNHLPTLAQIAQSLSADFSFTHPSQCNFAPLVEQVLLPEDQDTGVTGCVLTP